MSLEAIQAGLATVKAKIASVKTAIENKLSQAKGHIANAKNVVTSTIGSFADTARTYYDTALRAAREARDKALENAREYPKEVAKVVTAEFEATQLKIRKQIQDIEISIKDWITKKKEDIKEALKEEAREIGADIAKAQKYVTDTIAPFVADVAVFLVSLIDEVREGYTKQVKATNEMSAKIDELARVDEGKIKEYVDMFGKVTDEMTKHYKDKLEM